jgi:uncharacterized protein YlxW (UPF0749 family)
MTEHKHTDTGTGWPEPEPAPQPVPAPSGAARRSTAGLLIGLLVGLLAFAIVVQVRSNNRDPQLATARQDDLVRILSDLTAREQRQRAEIAKLEQTRSQLASGALGKEAALAEARRRASELGVLAGTLPAEGQGLLIRMMPGDRGIRAATVLEAVEELRGSGAEAMQIAGAAGPAVRIVASTYFVDGPDGLVVDGHALTSPYTISVIGPAQTMRTALTIPGGVADAVQRDGGNVTVDEPGTVRVDALHPGEDLRYARPVS